jgi:hypothetical protein
MTGRGGRQPIETQWMAHLNRDWLERRKRREVAPSIGSTSRPKSNWAQIIQASLTFVTVSLGVIVLLSWSKQELAKREAEFSFEMLKNVIAAQRCFEAALPVVGPANFEVDRVLSYVKDMLTTLEHCNATFSKLAADSAVANHILGEGIYRDASELEYLITNTVSSIRSVPHLVEFDRDKDRREPNYAEMAMAVLGRLGEFKWGDSHLKVNEWSAFNRSKSISEKLTGRLAKKISLSEAGFRLW